MKKLRLWDSYYLRWDPQNRPQESLLEAIRDLQDELAETKGLIKKLYGNEATTPAATSLP